VWIAPAAAAHAVRDERYQLEFTDPIRVGQSADNSPIAYAFGTHRQVMKKARESRDQEITRPQHTLSVSVNDSAYVCASQSHHWPAERRPLWQRPSKV
jgi:hypothetical protein